MRWIGAMTVELRGIAFAAVQELFRLPLTGAILHRLRMVCVATCGAGKEQRNLAQLAARL